MEIPENPKKSRERMPKSFRVGKKINYFFMRKFKMFAAVLSVAALMTSCSLTLPVSATSNPVGNKVGQSTGTVYLQVFAFDADASIRTAAKNGGITKISTVDIKQTNVLGIITSFTTIVTGE